MTIISISGIDGSGKTTQAKLLSDKINGTMVNPLFIILKKGKSGFSPRRDRLHKKKNPLTFLFGFPYALFSLVWLKVKYKNRTVVCDRYFFQFLYDIYGRRSLYMIRLLPKPDHAIFLDIDIKNARERMVFENDRLFDDFYYKEFVDIINKIKFIEFVDVKDKSIEEVHREIMTVVSK